MHHVRPQRWQLWHTREQQQSSCCQRRTSSISLRAFRRRQLSQTTADGSAGTTCLRVDTRGSQGRGCQTRRWHRQLLTVRSTSSRPRSSSFLHRVLEGRPGRAAFGCRNPSAVPCPVCQSCYRFPCRTDLFCPRVKRSSNHLLVCCSCYPPTNIVSCPRRSPRTRTSVLAPLSQTQAAREKWTFCKHTHLNCAGQTWF